MDGSGSDLSGSQNGSSVRVAVEPIYQPHAVVTALANQVKHRNRKEQEYLSKMTELSSERVQVSEQQRIAESELAKMREELAEAKRDRDYARAKLDLEESKRKLETANSEMQRINEAMEAEMELVRSESFGVPSSVVQMIQPDGDVFTDFLDSSSSDITQPVFIQQPDGRLVQIADPQTTNEPLFLTEFEDHDILYDDDTLLYGTFAPYWDILIENCVFQRSGSDATSAVCGSGDGQV